MMGMFGFTKSSRLLSRNQFEHVYTNGATFHRGPIRIHMVENMLEHNRLGLSVPRRAGNAVRRNRIKRLLREAFRLIPDPPVQGYDLVVTVRQHAPFSTEHYQSLLTEALAKTCR
ncbi:MAG: ribonuclease P protein component [Phycisphaerae bacterium]|nr:ribonuclease P protein component [Phycisphaerae bacterium]|tara:strand:+ start:561 stop:905 length:345 start_codon:yes stop_codon:yes gene_type:complete